MNPAAAGCRPTPVSAAATGPEEQAFRFKDFTDLRSGQPCATVAHVLQAGVSALF